MFGLFYGTKIDLYTGS